MVTLGTEKISVSLPTDLADYARRRAGGNTSAYIARLIERDRCSEHTRQALEEHGYVGDLAITESGKAAVRKRLGRASHSRAKRRAEDAVRGSVSTGEQLDKDERQRLVKMLADDTDDAAIVILPLRGPDLLDVDRLTPLVGGRGTAQAVLETHKNGTSIATCRPSDLSDVMHPDDVEALS